ncbi:MAG: hypothetical protein E7485_02345 [Ruminococcaceae bacterium]|nr:hypothetical protein [Oscillospiraceae bacterium]
MHWFERLYRLYDKRDVPLFHEMTYTDISIDLKSDGRLISARRLREHMNIPVTESSQSRTVNISPHPLCDNVYNLSEPKRRAAYLQYLREWACSEYGNDALLAVMRFVERNCVSVILTELNIQHKNSEKVSFSVDGNPLCGSNEIIQSHIEYIRAQPTEMGICCISGEYTAICRTHPKKLSSPSSNAKLISYRERERLVFSGRFDNAEDVFPIGREVSFKAHAVLKRLISEGGVKLQNRIFVAFDESGNTLPLPLIGKEATPFGEVTLLGFCEMCEGRLSVTLYRTVSAAEYTKLLQISPINRKKLHEPNSGHRYEQALNEILKNVGEKPYAPVI